MNGETPATARELPTRVAGDSLRRLAPGSLLGGRYRIDGLLGIGGMGMVYQALDERLGLGVAVKVLRPELAGDGRWLERFEQELVLARQVSHRNVVRIHDIGSDGEIVFLTMDLVAGRSLRELLLEHHRLGAAETVGIARQLALGLGAAHGAGVVHRDLKPANVLVDESGGGSGGTGGPPRIAISDFGVARSLTGAGLTLPGAVIGTLGYLSPEQARGDAVDARSDLYALGLLLYEMLAGELPFSAATEAEMLAQRLTGAPKLRWLGVQVPVRLRDLVQRLLARDPARRPQDAAEVVAALDRCLAGPPATKRWMLAAAACLVGLVALGWAAHQHARRTALTARTARSTAPPASSTMSSAPLAGRSRHALALLPLADDTGRPELAWVAAGVPEMLAAALAENPGIRVLDSQQAFRTLADLKLPAGPQPAAETRRLAALLDADRLVAGRVHAAGGRLRIDLSLSAADASGGAPAAFFAEAPKGEAFRLVAALGRELRRRLALPAAGADPAASRSPAALAGFSQGIACLARGDILGAVPPLERAVAADPMYTAAWVRLAESRQSLGREEPAREAARRAVETLGPGESRAALEVRAVEARLLGRPDRAQEILSRLLTRYPDDTRAQVALAEAYGEQGSLDRATATLARVVLLAPHHPRAWFLLGKYAVMAGNARRAADEYLVRALVVQNELGSEQGRAEVLNAFGVAYRDLGDMQRAEENYTAAAAIRRRIGDSRGYATTLRNLANLHTVRGDYALAGRQLAEALALLERLGDRAGIADLDNDLGVLAEQRGSYGAAFDHYRQAMRLRRDLGDDVALAQSFGNVGFACYLLGRYDDALVYWQQGLDLASKSGDPRGVVLATQNLGQLEIARGSWEEAAKSFLASLGASRELGLKEATAVSLGNLGRLAHYAGRPGAALASYGEALAVLRELGDRRGLAEFTLASAEVEAELGMVAEAARHREAAGALLAGEKNHEQQAELERLRGEALLAAGGRGDPAAASLALRAALAEATASHAIVELLAVRLSAAGLPRGSGETREAAAALAPLERLRGEVEALGNARLRLRADEAVARAALAAGDAARAERAARDGLEQAAASGGYAGAYRLHWLLAGALERGGRRAEAATERRHSAEEITRIERDLPPGPRQAFNRLVNGAEPGGTRPVEAARPAGGDHPGQL